jgi:hypothetical protein
MAKDILWATPPDVRQNYNNTCWAAVMESFCATAPGRPKLDQEQIFTQFERFALKDESMARKGLRTLFSDVRWGLNQMDCPAEAFSKGPEFLYQKLTAGNVILGYWETKIGGWHVSMAYGLKGRTVHYHNPDNSNGGRLKDDLGYFSKKSPVVVAWRKW